MRKNKFYILTGILLCLFISCSNLLDSLEVVPKQKYKISFELNEGYWKEDYICPSSYTEGESIVLPESENIEREGYVFCGWYEAQDFSDSAITVITEDAKGNKLYYAKWEEAPEPEEINEEVLITYTFKLNGGNLDGSSEDIVVSGKEGSYLPQPGMPKSNTTGYTFDKWDSEIPALFGSEDKTFTAQYVAGTAYTVKHILITFDEDYPEKLASSERVIGTPGGYTEATAKEQKGYTPQSITQVPIADDETTVVIVYYDLKTVSYTFSADGGFIAGVTDDYVITGQYTTALPKKIPSPSKRGYRFKEWDPELPETFGIDDATFTPVWRAIEYRITYENCSSVSKLNNPERYNIETDTITLEEPEWDYHTFSGWYKTSDFTGVPVTEIPKGSVGAITLYAKWTPWPTIVAPKDYSPTITYNYYDYGDDYYEAYIKAELPSHCTDLSDSNYKYTFMIDDIPLAIKSSPSTSCSYDISSYIRSLMPGTYTVMVTVEIYDVEGSYSNSYQLVIE